MIEAPPLAFDRKRGPALGVRRARFAPIGLIACAALVPIVLGGESPLAERRETAPRAEKLLWAHEPLFDDTATGLGLDRLGIPRSVRQLAQSIDRHVEHALHAAGLEPASPAALARLARRVYVDLTGLPPRFEDLVELTGDPEPEAWEKLVDRLLASPRFGERWARYWLDLVRFAETSGYERDQTKTGAWRYRDWVVAALNLDMPFDRFVLEQIAGDELVDRDESTVIATGFLRLGTWNDEPNDPAEYVYERLEDLVDATSTAFLATSLRCARCHDHKYDPIAQTDYYRVAGAFWPGPIGERDRALLGGPSREELGFDVLGWTDITTEPAPLHLLEKGDPKRPAAIVEPSPPGFLAFTGSFEDERSALARARETRSSPVPTTGRRLTLAKWIASARNPLTARVAVNRLWQHHFGRGLVRTPNDFGARGDVPVHRALLDDLALELLRGGWQTKRLHRALLLTRVYRQDSLHAKEAEYALRDGALRWIWRAERRRLDAESLRDAMLLASGRLDLRVGGESFHPEVSEEALEGLSRKAAAWEVSPPADRLRRSLYLFTRRSLIYPFFTAFDFCDTTRPCGERDRTIVPTQALSLLNGALAVEESAALAERAFAATRGSDRALIVELFRRVFARDPDDEELALALEYLAPRARDVGRDVDRNASVRESAARSLAHVLLNTNEFAHVD